MDKKFEQFSKKLTAWIGSPSSIIFHTIFFIGIFALRFLGVRSDDIMLVLTTIVSLEAIYLSIFIQMTVNKHAQELEEVSEDIEEIQEDVDEIQGDVDEIQKDVDEIQEDVDNIEEDLDEIAEEIQDDSEETP
jgi:low affinity Fe/Cu permease